MLQCFSILLYSRPVETPPLPKNYYKSYSLSILAVPKSSINVNHIITLYLVSQSIFLFAERDRDRERAQARARDKQKQAKEDGLTPEQRRERDAKALQEKAARKAAQAASGGNNDAGGTFCIMRANSNITYM
ncbi:4F5 domain-containing protein [Forsythia ovata]|uniref:4F5 domain-containing protein n=1 Tax=Forsythia ovata TaxID=205694 RepID=A0ABD1T5P7_9LAMI